MADAKRTRLSKSGQPVQGTYMTTIAATFGSARGRAVSSSWVDSPSTFSLRHGLAATIEQSAHTPRAHAASTPPRHAVNQRGRAACST